MALGDPANTGHRPGGIGPKAAVEPAWRLDSNIFTQPVVSDGTVYVGGEGQTLYAVDAETGRIEWTVETPGENEQKGVPAVVDDTVYVGQRIDESQSGRLYAIDRESGERRWRHEFETLLRQRSPTVTNDTVYVTTTDAVVAIDATSGTRAWMNADVVPTPGPHYDALAVADGTVYLNGRHAVTALAADTGEIHWRHDPDHWSGYSGAVTIADGRVVATSVGYIGLDADSGDPLWDLVPGRSIPSYANGTVYLEHEDSGIVAVDAATGDIEWRLGYGRHPLSIADGVLYAAGGTADLTVLAVDAATGTALWESGFQGSGEIQPVAVADGTIYATVRTYEALSLYALEPA